MSDFNTICDVKNPFKIVKGEDRSMPLRFVIDSNCNPDCEPFPLPTPATTEIIAKFLAAAGGCVEIKLSDGDITIVSEAGGKILIEISATNSALLQVSDKQDFEVEITQSGKKTISQILGCLTVKDSVCV